MRAVLRKRAGSPDRLELAEVPTPVPGENEILVRVHAATVTRGDVILRRIPSVLSRLFRLGRKDVLGHEFAGVVEAAGPEVAAFRLGDRVFGTTTGLPQGAHADYVCVPEDGVVASVPDRVSLEEAAPVPIGGLTALFFLRKGNVAPGKRVLVYGASGSVGTFAVQLAAHFGARVTGVCSVANVELVRSLGAGEVIDYTKEDFAEAGPRFDLVFDAVGKTTRRRSGRALRKNGAFVSVRSSTAQERVEDLRLLADLLEAGAIRAVIDGRYPLEQLPDAHRYVEHGHKRGNVVIAVVDDVEEARHEPAAG